MARTAAQSNDHSLFPDEQSSQLFPLIPINVKQFTYLSALLPRDQIFEDDQQSQQSESKEDKQKKEEENQAETEENDENKEDDSSVKDDGFNKENENDLTDNPYLRPTKICRRRGAKLIGFSK